MKRDISIDLLNLTNTIDISYDRVCQCYGDIVSGNCEIGVCRDALAEDVYINASSFDYNAFNFYLNNDSGKKTYEPTDIEKYCIDKLVSLNGGLDGNNFETKLTGGYYGEEIDSVTFLNAKPLISDIETMFGKDSDIEKIFYVLKKQYGFIAYILKDCKDVEIIKEHPANIKMGGVKPVHDKLKNVKTMKEDDIIGVVKNDLLVDCNHKLGYIYHKDMENIPFAYIKLS